MTVVDNFGVPEPQWILDQTDSGPLFWRRDSMGKNSRVKFRYEVEIKEFQRGAHELEEAEWCHHIQGSNILTMGMTCLFCITVTVILPWFILIGNN
ncbi:uncharacterized protein LOC108910553 [Anoplophora glabripennis]|uniref:uncharacterized protein LOC108910553 n=1 Tax=Anoplophora glabripennis TaxID=217634 RepID=UPI0008748970|nr:uncharacterized protein LOC108910553 [Anoplophora glabripennis]XP_018570710.1 uncharacterized protein LOC108910553 [Anoplophora glabripennis]